ncbi:MAG: T9SS type A sorting domain-containing protein [Chitinophagaceae bacterium]|nr:T9SS type A sorting domain-containing protein [Chitinophagaceae bacterium]
MNGTANLPSIDGQSDNFLLLNFGRVIVTGSVYFGNKAKIQNSFGATMEFKSGVNTNNIEFLNLGIIKITGNWYLGNNSKLNNQNAIEASGQIEFNSSEIVNAGRLQSAGKFIISQGTYQNNCRTIAGSQFQINSTTVTNNGLIWLKADGTDPKLVNGGTINGMPGSTVKAVNLENNGKITGNGYYYFTGTTTHNNKGSIGVNNSTDRIYVYDVTRSNANTIFDAQYGTVNNNVSYSVFAAPDTVNILPNCGVASRSELLPVKWNYFTVNVSNNIPTLKWSSEQDNGTKFEIERSYDNRSYSVIHSFVDNASKTNFVYNDDQVNTHASVVYYRVRATEPTGAQKITDTRSVRFHNQAGLKVQTTPNPFNNQFSISFQSTRRENLTVLVYNLAGQQQFAKTITVANGFNSITINEAASLKPGMYMVQLVGEAGVVSTEKIVKN